MNVHWDQKVVELAEKPMVVSEILKFSKKKERIIRKNKKFTEISKIRQIRKI